MYRKLALDCHVPLKIYFTEEKGSLRNNDISPNDFGLTATEAKEVHLQDALKQNKRIPIPQHQYEKIPDEIYDKLYPKINEPMPPFPIRDTPRDDIIDYDMDTDDDEWLKNNCNLKLTPLQFEALMEKLENKCSTSNHFLKFKDVQHIFKHMEKADAKTVYSYWADKRLRSKVPLIPKLKTQDEPNAKRDDPYVVFRSREKPLETRRNRAKKHENYVKLLRERKKLETKLKKIKVLKLLKQREQHQLKLKFKIVEDLYKEKKFNQGLIPTVVLYVNAISDMISDDKAESIPTSDQQKNSSESEEDQFSFKRKTGMEYFRPINDDLGSGFSAQPDFDEASTKKSFRAGKSDLVGRRIGRGGRIIFEQ